MSSQSGSVALYWDFENLHAGVIKQLDDGDDACQKNAGKPQEAVLDVAAIRSFADSLGTVVINRAFAHWGKFQRYRVPLLEATVDLVQLFPVGVNGKNGADIRLCLDVMEDMARLPHIQTIVVAAGDSDYLPLAHKIRASGRKLYGIGGLRSTNLYWLKSCHGFIYYEHWIASLTGSAHADPSPASTPQRVPGTLKCVATKPAAAMTHKPIDDALKALVVQAILRIAQQKKCPADDWIPRAQLRPMLKTLDANQDKRCYGFAHFKTFISHLNDLLDINPKDHNLLRLKPGYLSAGDAASLIKAFTQEADTIK